MRGVFPVVPTPFNRDGTVDQASFTSVIEYGLRAGAHGFLYPANASEFFTLSTQERTQLVEQLINVVAKRVPTIVGVSSPDPDVARSLARHAGELGADCLLLLIPSAFADRPDAAQEYVGSICAGSPCPVMLQNAPPPLGADLPIDVLRTIVRRYPAVQYVKEEGSPSGQRISALLHGAGDVLRGVFGGDGGRSLPNELARGVAGTMPAIELTEMFVALWDAHERGDVSETYALFERMLPLLNVQRVFRWAMTKQILCWRGIIANHHVRAPGAPMLDETDLLELRTWYERAEQALIPWRTA